LQVIGARWTAITPSHLAEKRLRCTRLGPFLRLNRKHIRRNPGLAATLPAGGCGGLEWFSRLKAIIQDLWRGFHSTASIHAKQLPCLRTYGVSLLANSRPQALNCRRYGLGYILALWLQWPGVAPCLLLFLRLSGPAETDSLRAAFRRPRAPGGLVLPSVTSYPLMAFVDHSRDRAACLLWRHLPLYLWCSRCLASFASTVSTRDRG